MIIAIPSRTDKTDALIDDRFARCSFFCFYNTETKEMIFKENNLKNGMGGVGPQVAEFLANNQINKTYAVEYGPKAKDVLNKLKIDTQLVESGLTVKEIIELFNH